MKSTLYSQAGAKKSEIELPSVFNSEIREDIASKYFEAEKSVQPYASFSEAGKRHSASGTIRRRRHAWKGGYGRGAARTPRKKMWRRGTQFYWIGAEVANTRGGRRAHPPRAVYSPKKINSNEVKIAMNSALASTADKKYIAERYSSISKEIISLPAVIESLPAKTKDAFNALKSIFGNLFNLIIKSKSVRAGRGKTRGRKYKSNAGLLLITGNDEKVKLAGIDIRKINELKIADLFPLGRLTLCTKKAIQEMGASQEKKA